MERSPRYEARPLRACMGIVARMPASAASEAERSISPLDAPRASPSRIEATAGSNALTMVEGRLVSQGTPRLAQRRPPEWTAGAPDGGHEGLPREDQQLARCAVWFGAQRQHHGVESTIQVDAMVTIADRRVELDQVVPLGADRCGDFVHPRRDGLRIHCYSD